MTYAVFDLFTGPFYTLGFLNAPESEPHPEPGDPYRIAFDTQHLYIKDDTTAIVYATVYDTNDNVVPGVKLIVTSPDTDLVEVSAPEETDVLGRLPITVIANDPGTVTLIVQQVEP